MSTESLQWQQDAPCGQVDSEIFFPQSGGSIANAKKVCKSCDVQQICLEYSLNKPERYGVWGGLPERQRRSMMNALGISFDEPESVY